MLYLCKQRKQVNNLENTKSCRAEAQQPIEIHGKGTTVFQVIKEKIDFVMKKIVKSILAIACFFSIILAGGENPDGSCNIFWTMSWLGVAVISALIIQKMEEAK